MKLITCLILIGRVVSEFKRDGQPPSKEAQRYNGHLRQTKRTLASGSFAPFKCKVIRPGLLFAIEPFI